MGVAISIVAILVVGVLTVVVLTARSDRRSTGSLSRETRREDAVGSGLVSVTSTELEPIGRERAHDTRSSFFHAPEHRRRRDVTAREPVTEDELGVSRRQFLNRALGSVVGISLAGFGAATLGFLWPTGSAGFGGKIGAGAIKTIDAYIEGTASPFYVPEARAYIVQYPAADLAAAKKVYSAVTYAGMQEGFVALYQRCPHLGCRVPWCQTSQWFECPCHGSKYNRVGEKTAGPAPRGMDRFAILVSGGNITVNTADIELGPPIGTNTTGQQQEGPLCV